MNKYSVCIIGCGDIGYLFDRDMEIDGALTHFKAFNDSVHFEVSAAAEINTEICGIISSEQKLPVYQDYIRMCQEIRPDVIVIATNDESHFEILKEVVKSKPKFVFCEKPVSLKAEEVKIIYELYKRESIPLQVNYTRRFLHEFYDIDEMIKGKKIGDLESATFYYSRGLIHNASHYLDLINWYIGETEKKLFKVSVKQGLTEKDETVSFDMIYESGPEVRFIGLNPRKLSFAEVDFVGTKGRIKINYNNEIEKYKVTDNKLFKGYSAYEIYDLRPIEYAKALPNAVENIFNVLSKGDELRSPVSNSLKIFELINRITKKEICQN